MDEGFLSNRILLNRLKVFPHKLHLNYEEKNGNLQQINLVNTTLIKVNMNLPTNTGANQHHVLLDMLPWDGYINSVVFPQNADHESNYEKNQTNPN